MSTLLAVTVVLAFGVGVSLGLLGGGGSILSVPLLVYVAGWDAHAAATGSLVVVGATSLIGLLTHARAGRVRWRTGFSFGGASMVGAYLGGRLAAHVPATVLLGAFAAMMLAASVGMIRGRRESTGSSTGIHPIATVALGALVGLATGFVGAGGGFVVVPALVLAGGLAMPNAVGTSLLVITLQSAAGFAGHLHSTPPPWGPTLAITASAMVGSLLGGRLTARIAPATLRRRFGQLVIAVAVLVLAEQLPAATRSAALPWVGALVLVAGALIATWTAVRIAARTERRTTGIYPHGFTVPAVDDTAPSGEPSMPTSPNPTDMIFTQYYVDCLSQASYLVGDRRTGQAVVIDPRRDVQDYLDDARDAGLTLIGMINTHFHADFLSGHLELAAATGAWIGYGARAEAEFPVRHLADGERIVLGDVVLEIMETPGHTPESISVLVYEHAGDDVPYGVLTGDTLFIGDVGRPDLLASIGVTAQELGVQLYDSIQHKLMGLPDAVRVFPGHGAGSACGKNLSTEKQSTIGQQRIGNYACRPMSREEFVALVTAGQPAAPEYFVYDAILNRKQRDVFVPDRPLTALDAAGVEAAVAAGAVVLDTRDGADFAAGHLAGALSVPADGRFAETAGMVLSADQDVVVIAPDGRHDEVTVRLGRIGFDRVVGYVADPEAVLLARPDSVRRASRLTAPELAAALAGPQPPVVIDVRNPGELEGGHLPGALTIPLAQLRRRLDEVPTDRPLVTYCAGGWRSGVAAGLLRHHGRTDVSDLLGGFAAWQSMHEPVTA